MASVTLHLPAASSYQLFAAYYLWNNKEVETEQLLLDQANSFYHLLDLNIIRKPD